MEFNVGALATFCDRPGIGSSVDAHDSRLRSFVFGGWYNALVSTERSEAPVDVTQKA